MHIYGIAALGANRIIGRRDGILPWHIPEDFRIFKRVTMGHTIVMGRKTFESIGKPLPGRTNVVITSDELYKPVGVKVVHSVDEIVSLSDDTNHVIICGGAQIYEAMLPYMSHIHTSTVYGDIPTKSGDVIFPEFQHLFTEYDFKHRFDKFEYGIYKRDKGQLVPDHNIILPHAPATTDKLVLV